ncbi:MAG: type II secretion system protein GspM [Pseudomonadota bacterium]
MREFWNTLTASQKYYVAGGAAFVVMVLVFQFVVSPLWDARKRTINAIAANEKVLKQMTVLGQEYGTLKIRAEAVQRVLSGRSDGFSLFSYLEKKAGEIQLKPHINYINPAKGVATGSFEESSVEMRLDSITMKQLTDFLYRVESPKDFIKIRKISINKMKEAPNYLTATLQVLTYQPAKPGSS